MNRYKVVCGNPGVGKSTFIERKYNDYFLVACDIPFIERTYSIIESSLSSYFRKRYSNHQRALDEFFVLLSEKDGVIVDNAEKIDVDTLKLIVNISKLLKLTVIFIFDIPYAILHTNDTFIKLIEWNIIDCSDQLRDFHVGTCVIEQFIQNEYPFFDIHELENLLRITDYNFNEIKKLMWINKVINGKSSKLSDKAISEYRQNKIIKQLSQLEPELSDILKKSSVIGQVFEKYPLESSHGFHILGLSNHLHDLELFGTFISRLVNRKDYYQFITPELYTAIFSSIHSSQKCEWQEILKNYYIYLYNHSSSKYTKTELIVKAKYMAIELTDYATVIRLNRVLLHRYLHEKDFNKAILIINELINTDDIENKTYHDYLSLTKLKLLFSIGDYRQAIDITRKYVLSKDFAGSEDYLLYHHVRCLYNCGDIDSAFSNINILIQRLKSTSKAGALEQKIYPLAYSMMASIQNHLGIKDNGKWYYRTALNYAYNNIEDKTLYFNILSKCEMFYSSEYAIMYLKESAEYFKKQNNQFNAARVCFNLATELLFNGSTLYEAMEKNFTFAKQVFQLPDEHLAYVKNNHAIFLMMIFKNFQSAACELESSLFVGLSDFTYMTIYLNLSMCYYYLYGNQNLKFISAYENFMKYEKTVESRKNRTRYEVIYRIISEIIFFNRNDSYLNDELQQYWSINQNDSFFKKIIKILTEKNQKKPNLQQDIEDNITLFRFVDEYGLFLAEFRFWD